MHFSWHVDCSTKMFSLNDEPQAIGFFSSWKVGITFPPSATSTSVVRDGWTGPSIKVWVQCYKTRIWDEPALNSFQKKAYVVDELRISGVLCTARNSATARSLLTLFSKLEWSIIHANEKHFLQIHLVQL